MVPCSLLLEDAMKNENRETQNEFVTVTSPNWLQRIGIAGFIFFLAKGLLWIIAVAWVAY